ncbi:MAG: tRNA pseudouridine(13) synthase TruD [Gammaproteobacteria bacterium]
MPTTSVCDWPRAGGPPRGSAVLRQAPEDFQVEEVLNFSPSGEGQHVLVLIRKRDANTEWVARQLALHAGIGRKAVGYAGLKDRRAVTEQWFSVDLAGAREPDWSQLDGDEVTVLQHRRHHRKLRQGAVQANRFRITLRALRGECEYLEQTLQRVTSQGVPNYFGEQRFGRNNLQQAAAMLLQGRSVRDRFKRGIYLSAARSLLFNRVLAKRVVDGNWDRALVGDVMMLAGSHSIFSCPESDADIARRLAEGDIHPTGPLWGCGNTPCHAEAAALEEEALSAETSWCRALEEVGLKHQRRALRVIPQALQWRLADDDSLTLTFTLPSGCYATSVLREVVGFREKIQEER